MLLRAQPSASAAPCCDNFRRFRHSFKSDEVISCAYLHILIGVRKCEHFASTATMRNNLKGTAAMANKQTSGNPREGKRGPGRPTDYRPEFAEQAAKLCALGATDYELADFFGVDTRTIYRWKNVHDDFCQSVTCGKERADERVERALFNRAVGYTFESEKVFQFQGAVIRADTVEHVPPDPSAAKLWLTNRKPEQWREKQQIEHSGPDGGPVSISVIRREIVEPDSSKT